MKPMTEPIQSSRTELIRESAIFQLKLLADGIRDAVLIPVALVATIIGVLRGGDEPDREFRRVIELGVDSERWINLFNHHEPLDSAGSIDDILSRVETVVKEQYRKGNTTDGGKEAIDRAIEDAHKAARQDADN
jgi:hypothetical protein